MAFFTSLKKDVNWLKTRARLPLSLRLSAVDESEDFARRTLPFLVDEGHVAGQLAELGNLGKGTYLDGLISQDKVFGLTTVDFISGHLVRRQLHRHGNLILLRQFLDDLTLGATKQERRDETAELILTLLVVVDLDGHDEFLAKLVGTA